MTRKPSGAWSGHPLAEFGMKLSVHKLFIPEAQVANFTAILDKDLSDRRRTAEMDIQPLLTYSYTGRIKVCLLAVLCMLCKI